MRCDQPVQLLEAVHRDVLPESLGIAVEGFETAGDRAQHLVQAVVHELALVHELAVVAEDGALDLLHPLRDMVEQRHDLVQAAPEIRQREVDVAVRPEEHPSELTQLMRTACADFYLKKK